MQAGFFQSHWKVIEDYFCNFVLEVFRCPKMVSEINATFLMLIPKIDNATHIKDFKPISLCNVSYKAITKLVAKRLRDSLPALIGPAQGAFVPRRQSQDNIVIAQEIFHSMRKKKGKTGWMAVKIDLEKAYDRLNWNFIKDTLEDIGLPPNIIYLIWFAISTPSMRLLWNGEALNSFSPQRGIRQGDPLSPYLFVLCLERLFQLIQVAVGEGAWKPIKMTRSCPMISHPAFADDLLLFAEASSAQATIMIQILEAFCNSSGQKVSLEKTRVFFFPNVESEVMEEVCGIFGFFQDY